jgi:hypothetical protein
MNYKMLTKTDPVGNYRVCLTNLRMMHLLKLSVALFLFQISQLCGHSLSPLHTYRAGDYGCSANELTNTNKLKLEVNNMGQQTNTSTVWKKFNPEEEDPYVKDLRKAVIFYDQHYHRIKLGEINKMKLANLEEGHLYEIENAIVNSPLISVVLTRDKDKIFLSLGIKSQNLLAGKPFKIPVSNQFRYLEERYQADWCILKDWKTSESMFEWFSAERTLWATKEVKLNTVEKIVAKIKHDLDIIFPYIFYIYRDILNAEIIDEVQK